eukprot:10213030-Alexandrium_andersonii.AAC.1
MFAALKTKQHCHYRHTSLNDVLSACALVVCSASRISMPGALQGPCPTSSTTAAGSRLSMTGGP